MQRAEVEALIRRSLRKYALKDEITSVGPFVSDRAIVSDANGDLTEVSGVTSTELGFIGDVTSEIQSQLNGKMANPPEDGQLTMAKTNGLQAALAARHVASVCKMTGPATSYCCVGTIHSVPFNATTFTIGSGVTAEPGNNRFVIEADGVYRVSVHMTGETINPLTVYVYKQTGNVQHTLFDTDQDNFGSGSGYVDLDLDADDTLYVSLQSYTGNYRTFTASATAHFLGVAN